MALTNWRVNIGAGSYENREAKEVDNSWNRTECFLSPDGKYDFTKQAGQQWFMKAASGFRLMLRVKAAIKIDIFLMVYN